LTVTRLSPKNFETTSGFKTVGDNEGAYTGERVLLEDEATNLTPIPQDFSLSGWIKSGGTSVGSQVIAPDGTLTAYVVDFLSESDYLRDTALTEPVEGRTFTTAFYLKANGNVGDTITIRIQRNSGGVTVPGQTQVVLTDKWVRYSATFTGVADNVGLRFQVYRASGDTATTCQLWQCDVTESSSPSSPIFQGNTTRNADTATVPTSNAFVDAECFLGNFNSGTAVKGVNLVTSTMTFFATDVPERGKYYQEVGANWVGAILTAVNGAQVQVASINNDVTFVYSVLRGTDQEIQEGFEYPNRFTKDSSRSAYDLAGAKALRQSVGDYGKNIGNTVSFSSLAAGSSVGGNTLTINGSYASSDPLIGVNIDGVDIKATAQRLTLVRWLCLVQT